MQHDQGNESGHIDDQPDNEAAPKNDCFQKPDKPLTPNRAWNRSKFVDFRPPLRIIAVTSVKVIRLYDYGYLEEIVVRSDDNVLYKFKEGDFPRLNLCDIKDMLLLLVQKKLSNLDVDDRVINDIASNLEMDYLEKRHWSNSKMKRSSIMVKVIDKLLFERRLMRNLENFIGRRDYENDLRLLDQTI
nr:hypothetical protein [Tanacetum cinerariifolium]